MKNEIATTWIQLAILTGRQLNQSTVDILLRAVEDLPQQEVLNILNKWPETDTNFPLPAHIRAKIFPVKNEGDDILESVNRALTAVSRFGYCNSEDAKNYIGELGWEIVTGMGGWYHICEILGRETPEGVMRKQMLDYGQTVWKRVKLGEHNEPPRLPNPVNKLAPILKSIE